MHISERRRLLRKVVQNDPIQPDVYRRLTHLLIMSFSRPLKHHNEDKYKSSFLCKRFIITVVAFKKEAEQFRNNLPNLIIYRI